MLHNFSAFQRVMHSILGFITLFFSSGCTSLFYQPDRFLYATPEALGLKGREFSFSTANGEKIFAWLIQPHSGKIKGTFIQFHGNAQNLSSHFTFLAELVKEGYQVFIFDYQGYGKSTGEPSQERTVEDGILALKEGTRVHRETAPDGKLILIGQSLGGAVLLRAIQDFPGNFADELRPPLLVLDSTFLSYKSVGSRVLRKNLLTAVLSPLPYVLVSNRFAPDAKKLNFPFPVIVMHDEKDPIVPFACGQEIFSAVKDSEFTRAFWVTQKGSHVEGFEPKSSEKKRMLDFLETL